MTPQPHTYLDKMDTAADLKVNIEKKCVTCNHYGFKVRPEDLWTYCYAKEEWFPMRVHPGEYVCELWEAKEYEEREGGK